MFKPVTDNIYMVSTTDTGKIPSSFCFYIDDDTRTLIDTPLDPKFADYFSNRPVDMILNTHFHLDHTGCNHFFPGASIYAHHLDIPPMRSKDCFCQYYGVKSNTELGAGLLKWLNYTPSPISGQLHNGDIIKMGKIDLEVIHTPGHTPGHCAFYWREKQILFAGDIDLTGFGPWYGNSNSDVTAFINSIQKIIELDPKMILSAHKGIITENIPYRLQNYLNRIYENEQSILAALKTPLTIEELTSCKIIYRSWPNPVCLFKLFESVALRVHLRRLLQIGKVYYKDNRYWLADYPKSRYGSLIG